MWAQGGVERGEKLTMGAAQKREESGPEALLTPIFAKEADLGDLRSSLEEAWDH